MTENPTQGAAPENRNPDENRNADQNPAEVRSDAVGQANTTEQLDRSGAPDNPTQPLPGAPRPVFPPREPLYGQQTPGQQAPGHEYAQHGAHSAAPGGSAGQHNPGQHNPGQYGTGQYSPGQYNAAPNPADAPRKKASFGVGTLVASILAAGLVGGGVATVGSGNLFNNGSPSAASSGSQSETVIVNNKDDVNAITAAALKASPSVVTISATSGSSGGTGSGIVMDNEGHILTNTHVVTLDGQSANAALEVRTSAGKVLKATLVGTDPLSDLAVIKVDDASGLTAATLGDSGKLNVGDTAIAIGSPLGLTGTVTDGIVSTLNRTISVASSAAPKEGDTSQGGDQGFQFAPPNGGQGQSTANQGSISINVIQTDAAINPGNSGGALVNSKGEIIGVNVAIASAGSDSSTTGGNIGVGFSIPINHAKRVAQEIIDTGKASHGQLGVSVKEKSSSSSSSGFSVGADVATVEPNSAAAKAGIKVGDVVIKFNDLVISEPNQLTAAVREQAGGSTVKLTVLRNGQEQTLDVTLGTAADQ
ncbi:trypsin-like peptidase domain-containing protein [Pseudarthrobacter sp. MDT3-26]|uniref:trypsin-like peptidase domain-containing protein n=1 Tax=Pseudarthrobacter raffinosi TaxID=2953651 RepID=UPI00208E33EB|nr:trypsin-like peptidase domain-containing protein [Pseudarthrobacter sp. MDT3-26]MCO4263836.1 trypsin-like peptidase domain-containing protein [Pseudarthrobacter sp. MDT3-26]